MNRLVIIGNGFDLAHGLPTGYCDFINDLWKKIANAPNLYEDLIYLNQSYIINLKHPKVTSFKDFKDRLNNYIEISKKEGLYKSIDWDLETRERYIYAHTLSGKEEIVFKFNNHFFRTISENQHTQNWVDIENEYYKHLKDFLNEKKYRQYNIDVIRLNEEFKQVKDLFEKYLMDEICNKYNFDKPNHEINAIIKEFNVWNRVTDKDDFREEFPQNENEVTEFINILSEYRGSGKRNVTQYLEGMNIEVRNYFLSFNYTPTLDVYLSKMQDDYNAIHDDKKHFGQNTLIQIHGRLKDNNNLINFGFGDEMDDDYKNIERKNNNEYLKYIKSFQYTQNNNYKKLLDFIDSQKFQVYIMGHSCGLSDRILLNTIFEHENCRSIKIYFHQKDDGSNNYTDIVQNISRHFKDKKVMRSKIVNKSLCEPLHQEVRFDKKTN
ncbi:AbiH family protein [Flavobacterium coralii]|uniref:AbiH family protein n=1 Tax=Flavobacterium coralii TaxID=2838017 RepID=UPI000C66CB44|nr:hypothetical protein [Flavobacterium sp.]|tara:strand:+ start:19170 stop:20477 length:1308 start_codon:yes stop_codon:yes gene_type:complete